MNDILAKPYSISYTKIFFYFTSRVVLLLNVAKQNANEYQNSQAID